MSDDYNSDYWSAPEVSRRKSPPAITRHNRTRPKVQALKKRIAKLERTIKQLGGGVVAEAIITAVEYRHEYETLYSDGRFWAANKPRHIYRGTEITLWVSGEMFVNTNADIYGRMLMQLRPAGK